MQHSLPMLHFLWACPNVLRSKRKVVRKKKKNHQLIRNPESVARPDHTLLLRPAGISKRGALFAD